MYIGPNVKYPLFLSDYNDTWIFSTHLRKIFKYQIHENMSSGSRVVPCRQTEIQTDGWDR
jgi:hypothetical protein